MGKCRSRLQSVSHLVLSHRRNRLKNRGTTEVTNSMGLTIALPDSCSQRSFRLSSNVKPPKDCQFFSQKIQTTVVQRERVQAVFAHLHLRGNGPINSVESIPRLVRSLGCAAVTVIPSWYGKPNQSQFEFFSRTVKMISGWVAPKLVIGG